MSISEYERSRRNHPAQIAADARAFESLVASFMSGIVAKDPHDKPEPAAMSTVRIDGLGQFVIYHDGQPIRFSEDMARRFYHDLGKELDHIDSQDTTP